MADQVESLSRTNVVRMALCLVKKKEADEAVALAKKAATIELSPEGDFACEEFETSLSKKYSKKCDSNTEVTVASETYKWRM